jgi:uncharacterized protein (TIGR02466 family)
METEIQLHHLFSAPLYISKLSSINEDELNYIQNLEYELMFSKNGKYTHDKYILNHSKLSRIKNEIEKHSEIFTREILEVASNIEFYLTNSWSVLHNPGNWGQMHLHTNCMMSGVVYTKVHKNSGNIVFHRNMGMSVFPTAIDVEYNNRNILNAKTWELKPEDNMILLFPSHLLHSITENQSNKNRYSLAFNFFVRGCLGKNEFELNLP